MIGLLLLAQLATWGLVTPPVLHQGQVQACTGKDEYVLQHRVLGNLQWELHANGADFGLYAFHVAAHNHKHADALNLLSAPVFDDLKTVSGSRQWSIPSLHLWLSVVRAGEALGCESFYIKVVKQ